MSEIETGRMVAVGLKRLRNPDRASERAKHPEWGRPNNNNSAARLARRQAGYEAALRSVDPDRRKFYNKPGSLNRHAGR